MERYIGIDVHASSSTCCVLKASGKQLRRDVVETNGAALIGYLKQIAGNLHVCIEETEWSQWLVEILTPHVAEIVIVRKPWRPGAKNDALDAHDLAEQICTGRFECRVYNDPKRFTALRDLARAYMMVTRDRARTKNRI
ncbi:MAG: transposase, partial [Candidatus Eisenbacteria sp.]|nr:transposase [Candidatus Eisenbacteria bacterium]